MCQEQVEKALQQSGKRITQQRKILLDVILNGEWECCKEIYYEAVKRDDTVLVRLYDDILSIGKKPDVIPKIQKMESYREFLLYIAEENNIFE